MSFEVDPDLTEVFRLLYAGEDDWGTFDDDEVRHIMPIRLVLNFKGSTTRSWGLGARDRG